jgi:cobalt-zinc-cadmium efflux system membrane fusion protein
MYIFKNKKIILLLLVIGGCTSGNQSTEVKTDEVAQVEIPVTEAQMKEMGLDLGYLQKEFIAEGVAVNGYLDTPPQFKANVSTIIGGRIVNIYFLPGDYVRKGQEIVRLESPDFLVLQQNYVTARGELNYLKDEYERQKKLSENNVNARKIYLQAERDYQSKIAEFSALESQLKLLDVDAENLQPDQLSSIIRLRTPINGYISEVFPTMGEFVHTEGDVFRVVNPEHLHAELNVFEKDILKIKKGQKVEIKLPQMKDTVIIGEIFLVSKELDEESRSLNVHVDIEENQELVVGMYVEGRILTSEREVYVVPNEALMVEEKGSSIFMVTSKSDTIIRFKKIPVHTGTEREGNTQVFLSENVTDETQIAISGIYYLSSNE